MYTKIGSYFIIIFFFINICLAQEVSQPLDIVNNIIKICKLKDFKKNKILQNKVSEYIDFSVLANRTIVKFKNKLNVTNKSWYSKTLQQIITKTIYPEATQFLKNIKIVSTKEKVFKSHRSIESLVLDKGEEIEIIYYFSKKGNKWYLTDISIDDSRWSDDIKEQVDEIWDEYKWKGIKRKLKNKLMELK